MLSAAHDIIKSLDLNHSVSLTKLHINRIHCHLGKFLMKKKKQFNKEIEYQRIDKCLTFRRTHHVLQTNKCETTQATTNTEIMSIYFGGMLEINTKCVIRTLRTIPYAGNVYV